MDVTAIYNAMSEFTEIVGNILIVGSIAALAIIGRAIYKAYAPEEAGHES